MNKEIIEFNRTDKPAEWEIKNMRQLMENSQEEMPTLITPILPRYGLVGLVGSSDSGKSCLLRELAASVIRGRDFLLWRTSPIHRRVLYLSTEDESNAMSDLLKKQNETWKLSSEEAERMLFLFSSDNPTAKVEAILSQTPVDMVIVDSFGDICQGDLSQSNIVRNLLNAFARIAQYHGCLVVFLHHTRKSGDTGSPSKHNTLGSQSFEAKMRVVIELRRNKEEPDLLHLCIVKGNYLPKEYKKESFDIYFKPDLSFEATDARTSFEQLRSKSKTKDSNTVTLTDYQNRKNKQNKSIIEYHRQGKSAGWIARQLNISDTTVYRILKSQKINNIS